MGHPAGRLGQALQPLRLVQLRHQPVPLGLGLEPLPFRLGFQSLGHVPDRGRDQDPLVGLDVGQGDLRREGAAVPAARGQCAPDHDPHLGKVIDGKPRRQ